MVYGELGRYLLIINDQVCITAFWSKLNFYHKMIQFRQNYNVMGKMNRPWFKFIKYSQMIDRGLSLIFNQQNLNIQWLKRTVFHILLDQFKQSWNCDQ